MLKSQESMEVVRKKILLRLLARQEAGRLGITIHQEELQVIIDKFRIDYDLTTHKKLGEWLRSENLTLKAFVNVMYDFALLNRLEQIYDRDISREIPDYLRINRIRHKYPDQIFMINNVNTQPHWLQINVEINRSNEDALRGARALFDCIAPAISKWRRQKFLNIFYFMRKPPDLRLRFLVADSNNKVHSELQQILYKLKHLGHLKRFFPSIYEPEVYQFGGHEAMAAIHIYFDTDSAAWISFDHLLESEIETVSTETLVAAVMNDLFFKTLKSHSEVWDVWCNLVSLIHKPQVPHQKTEPIFIDSLLAHVSEKERSILGKYELANKKLSIDLWQIWEKGKLQSGLRSVLPFIAMFHFNRYGFGAEKQAVVANAMMQAWNPKKGLKGLKV